MIIEMNRIHMYYHGQTSKRYCEPQTAGCRIIQCNPILYISPFLKATVDNLCVCLCNVVGKYIHQIPMIVVYERQAGDRKRKGQFTFLKMFSHFSLERIKYNRMLAFVDSGQQLHRCLFCYFLCFSVVFLKHTKQRIRLADVSHVFVIVFFCAASST